jgi:hypothetical protein
VNEHVVELPAASVAVEITVVVPRLKVEPEAGTEATVAEQLSVAVELKFTTAPHEFASVFTIIFEGQVITGAWLSTTVTVNEHEVELPAASVAVEVTVVVPRLKVEPEAGTEVTVAEQLSVAVTLKFTTASHEFASLLTVMLEGQVIAGAWLSTTVTVNEHEVEFPAASVAVEVTVVEPRLKIEPEAGTEVTVAKQLSVAVALKFTTAPHEFASLFTVMFEGQVITGASLSTTVTVNEHVVTLPAASVAVEVTVVVPGLNVEPEAGTEVTVAEQLSVAVVLKFTTAPHELASVFAVMLEGQVITGASLSTTVTVNEHEVELPAASVAVEVTVVVPRLKVEPEAGTEVTVAEQLSVAVTL